MPPTLPDRAPRQPITDPLMQLFQSKLDRVRNCGPFELPLAVKDLCETAAVLLRDQQQRIGALERRANPDVTL